jgi:putative oxidoreductase
MTNSDKITSGLPVADETRLATSGLARRQWVDTAAVLARWLLGGLFIYMGLSKALHPVEFLKLVREYHLTANSLLLNAIAVALPWFEVFCGLLLLAGIAVRGTVLVLGVMLICFTLAVLHRALAIAGAQGLPFSAVKFDCGCGNGEIFSWRKLLENSFLILLSLWLLAGRGRQLCLRFGLFERREPRQNGPR